MIKASTIDHGACLRQIKHSKLTLRLFADVANKLQKGDIQYFEMIVEFLGGVFVTLIGIKFYIGEFRTELAPPDACW